MHFFNTIVLYTIVNDFYFAMGILRKYFFLNYSVADPGKYRYPHQNRPKNQKDTLLDFENDQIVKKSKYSNLMIFF